MEQIVNVDFETAEQAVLAAKIAEDVGGLKKPEKVPAHVRSFYQRMMRHLGKDGLSGDSQAAQSMKALAIKEQKAPPVYERLGRRDRQAAVKKLVDEGTIPQPKTRRTKDAPAVIDPRAIDHFLTQLPEQAKATEETLVEAVGRVFGFSTLENQRRASLRASRFMVRHPGKRLPQHIRSAAVMATAVMVATVAVFPEQADPAAIEAVATLRQSFGEA